MLERIHIKNYKCLREITVDLGDLTILIGPNDSGKSSFLDVVRMLGRVTNEPLQDVFAGDKNHFDLVWRNVANNIAWDVCGKTRGGDFVYHVEFPEGAPIESLHFQGKRVFDTRSVDDRQPDPVVTIDEQHFPVRPESTILSFAQTNPRPPGQSDLLRSLSRVSHVLNSAMELRFEPAKMTEPSVPRPDETLDPSGRNLAAFLDALLTGPDRSSFAALENDLRKAIPTLKGIALSVSENPPGAKCLRYVLAGNEPEPVTIPASQASTGTLLLTAFLALSYSKTPNLLLIEEPENGLHPSRLQLVVDVLRKMTTGELGGRKRQVIVTTHSPLLLNFAKPEEVRVFVADSEKGTQVKNMDKIPNADRLLKECALGEFWYLPDDEKPFEEQRA